MSQIEVQIMGQGYALACPDGAEARLQQAVQSVDLAMCKIRDAGKIKAREKIAVLAAINLAFEQTATPQPTPTSNASKAKKDSGIDLTSLINRLDDALAMDGQLL
jgi:cell division protein ZapA